jgi:hypothetical protein
MHLHRSRAAAKATMFASLAATLLASSRAQAQQQTQLSIAGGVGTDQRGARSSALTIAPSLSLVPVSGVSLSLGANVTRFGNEAWSFGGGAAFSARDAIAGPVALTLDASLNASQLRGGASASFASAELLPAVEARAGRVTLFAGGRAARGYASHDVASQSLPPFTGGTTTQRQTRSGFGPTFGATVDALSSPNVGLRFGARQDRLSVSGVTIVDRALSAAGAAGGGRLSGSVGRRAASDEKVEFTSVALSLPLRDDVALDAAAGRFASNRFIGTPGGDYFNVGLSLRFGSAPMAGPAPAPRRVRGAPRAAAGYTRLTIDARDAWSVSVAGDFNDWTPIPAARASDGVWYADLRLAPGQYRYAFRVNGKEWRVPRGATAVNDGFGGKSAWLIVGEPGRGP